MELVIVKMTKEDWKQVKEIYIEGILTGNATFETETPSWEKWDVGHLIEGRLVAKQGNTILGWAALSPVSSRRVYAGVAEVSIYIGEKYRGKGIGNRLLSSLIEISEKIGIWTLQAGIF